MPTTPALISSALGTLSIVTWLFAQLPQVYENHKLKSTAGLSVYFLTVWCLGDSTNLVGAMMTGQASWQVMLAAYYTCVDLTLVFQYWWYTHVKPQKLRKLRAALSESNAGIVSGYPLGDGRSQTQHSWPNGQTMARDDEMVETSAGNREIIQASQPRVRPSNPLPQALLASSICVAGANAAPISGSPISMSQAGSIVARSTTLATVLAGQSLQHEIAVGIQFLLYNKTTELVLHGERIMDSSDSEDGDDEPDEYRRHHHHTKSKAVNISGWMRGWIPSLPGSVPRSAEVQERQLLLAPHEQPYGTHH
ncbi:PQ loop repeat protein [Ascosphaera apis ARSEF 7405]|uniref:PQ loop repeat protein n=1 Tax=Ascosphaera apis ARSEF 7405 TaxID=392613 RepID=A0A167UZG3_9EURO|nr:PQ loop repeat protein [Ascosphaera apis ARSEF 7405]